jgi:hypothetical protein
LIDNWLRHVQDVRGRHIFPRGHSIGRSLARPAGV